MANTFDKKIALVTGGSTGIGAAVALELAESGAHVMITGRTPATLERSAARHPRISYVVADVSAPGGPETTVEAVRSRWDRLDVLVNNAGIFELAPLAVTSFEHSRRVFGTNVEGLIETTRLALPLLKQSRGAIVNVSSVAADLPFANMSVYSASKAAVLALTRAWARELAADGIRVNAVSPGPIETPIFSAEKLRMSQGEIDAMGTQILGMVPFGRFGKPEEVAALVAFLASPAASYVSGAQYKAAGGMEA